MKRREFINATRVRRWRALAARAQGERVRRIGVHDAGSDDAEGQARNARSSLQELGWT